MKLSRLLPLVAMLLLAVSVVRADDTRVTMDGGTGHSPACGSNLAAANSAGILTADCKVTSKEDGGTGKVNTFSFEVADSNTTGGGLTCVSSLTNVGWTLSVHNSGGLDTCTLTAPTSISEETLDFLEELGDPHHKPNDHDCDLDDFVLFIPVGCDIKFNNPSNGTNNLFVGNAPVGFSAGPDSLPSLPEPGTLSLALIGLAGLPFVRRKFAR